jgi:hypothetical protein
MINHHLLTYSTVLHRYMSILYYYSLSISMLLTVYNKYFYLKQKRNKQNKTNLNRTNAK